MSSKKFAKLKKEFGEVTAKTFSEKNCLTLK
jgi:hypothetical protein